MKRFRIVKKLVSVYEDKPVSTVIKYVVEQEYHIFGFLHWWSTPSFARNMMFNYTEKAEQFVWKKYPNAVII